MLPAIALCEGVLPPGVQESLNLRKAPENSLSIYIENLDTGELLLTWNEEVPRNPASVAKLLTTLVALDILGPAYTWKTEVYVVGVLNAGLLEVTCC